MRTVYKLPDIRGNLFLGLLLGVHFVIALPKSPDCAYAQDPPRGTVAIQHNTSC